MNQTINIPGVISHDELAQTAASIASLQLPSGMIPWNTGGHCDPWNHVETAMALDTLGLHHEARRAYEWLADVQRSDGSWYGSWGVCFCYGTWFGIGKYCFQVKVYFHDTVKF